VRKTELEKVFESNMGIKPDSKTLYKKMRNFFLYWLYRSKDHLDFISSNLIGVHTIKFTEDDAQRFYLIFDIDQEKLKKDLHKLHDINPAFNVASNPRYHLIMYLMHFTHTHIKNVEEKDKTIMETFYIFSVMVYSSLMTRYFSHNLDKDIALTVYEKLPRRFILKREGSWKGVFEYFGQYVTHKGLHEKALIKYNTKDVTLVITDMQGKIRSTVKELTRMVYMVMDINTARESRSVLGHDDEQGEIMVDIVSDTKQYHNAVLNTVYKPREFFYEDYITIMKNIYPNLYPKELKQTVLFMSENYTKHKRTIDSLLETAVNANIHYLYKSELYPPYDKSIIDVVKFLRGYWISSTVQDKENKKFKKEAADFVRLATNKKTKRVIVTVVTSLAIYIMLIAIKYSKPRS